MAKPLKHLSQPWFQLVKTGRKSHEGRINNGFWGNLKVGDQFVFFNDDSSHDEFCVEVEERLEFLTFENAINEIGLENVLPSCFDEGMSVKESVESVYYKYFKREEEASCGIVMLKFKIM
jgi:ASC-1-like (ASCH) protein